MLVSMRWYVVGACVPPHDALAVHRINQTLEGTPKEMEFILLGDINVRLREPWENREVLFHPQMRQFT